MGIQGLLPFVKNASRPVNVKDFRGCTVAVDTYCWLHKGAFSCAERLIKGEQTDGYVSYVIKMANMLISAGVHPILVFDGQRLPSKKNTEEKRRELREMNRKKAKQFLVEGKIKEARECYQRAVDITPEMAFDVIQACRSRAIDYIVAPYEADAQLAYLVKAGIADIVITEDSDLILFGCDKIIFKMDQGGNGVLVEASNLGKCLGNSAEKFTHEKFRQMCILSGCDYLSSLPGIGLAKALKFFRLITNPDLRATLPKLPVYLKMPQLNVTEEYIEGFLRAENTFLYQLVFCPARNKLVPLNPYPPGTDAQQFTYAGKELSDEQAFQVAVGNINVNTHATIDFYSPPNRKILKEHNSGAQKEDVKRTKLGAFAPITRSAKDNRHVPKTPPKRAQSLPTKENKSPEEKEMSQTRRTTSLINTRFIDDDDDAEDIKHEEESSIKQPKQNLAAVSTPPVNVFKVACKPPVLRSRFFSAPPKCNKKGDTEKPRSLLQSLESDCETPKSSRDKERTFSKFQWRRTSFSETFATQEPQAPTAALTPFKKLRMSMAKTVKQSETSPEGSSSRTSDEDKCSDQVELPEVQSDNGATTPLARTQIRNPFAKKPSVNASSLATSSRAEAPLSEDEDPIPKTESRQSTPDQKQSRHQSDFELEFEDSSPVLEERVCSRELEESGSKLGSCCEEADKSDDDETPLPFGRPTEGEEFLSGISSCIIVEDSVETEGTSCRGVAKTFLQSRPTKKAMPKTRRLGLTKTKPKKDVCQPSIVETLAKFKFKR
ncbi:exonuclease 1-like isoform X2 [Ornithodoros turicata]